MDVRERGGARRRQDEISLQRLAPSETDETCEASRPGRPGRLGHFLIKYPAGKYDLK